MSLISGEVESAGRALRQFMGGFMCGAAQVDAEHDEARPGHTDLHFSDIKRANEAVVAYCRVVFGVGTATNRYDRWEFVSKRGREEAAVKGTM